MEQGFNLWSRKIPHAAEQLSLCTTIEPARIEPVLHNKRHYPSEKPPLTTTRESLHTATNTQRSQKIKLKNDMKVIIKIASWTSLEIHWLGLHFPMQEGVG